MHLDISESTSAGERFSLNNALDPDIGSNSVKSYYLSESAHFSIEIQTGRDGSKFADLILKKALDREEQIVHNLILTAVDGGVPARSGTASIIVRVLDTNDNAPQFDKDSYTINLTENAPIGSLVVKLNATDKDEGSNSDILYSYSLYTSEKTQQTFSLNPDNGEIRVKEMINYEDFRIYDMEIIATDKGANSLSGKCKVTILVTDMNDNHPEISIKSFSSPVKEDIAVNTVIAVVSVSDKDSGENGQVDIHISDYLPFALKESSDNYYELLVSEPLDREKVPEYDITITVTDRGNPPLSDNETITLELLDVNDNVPQFPQTFYTIPVMENNAPGALLSSLTAIDPDLHENQYLVYFIIEKEIVNTSMSMLFSINPENGNLYALKTFDYEIEKEFLFHIEARDSGVPPLSSNVTVHIIIMDQNDNTPLIVSPWRAHGSVVEEKIPRSTDKGTLIAKVIAIDSDSVHNSRITYQFLHNTDATLFSLDQYNGEIRTMRMFSYRDSRHQQLVVIAKDNGEPALSATVTIKLSTVETALKTYADMTEVPLGYDIFSDLNLYLVIGLGSVSFLLLITILVTIVLKCQKTKPSKAAPPCRNSVISERNSTIADSTLVSNDAYWYSLFLAETRKGKLVVRQPVPKGARYIVSSIPRSTGLTETSDSAASTLQSALAVTHYSIAEEMEVGSVVANLATDLGLDVQTLIKRNVRLDVIANKKYLAINKERGELYIQEKIDREHLCPLKTTTTCFLKLEVTVENPVRIFYIELEITDINDNNPHFRRDTINLDITESTPAGERFSVSNAVDSDVGSNSVKTYYLSKNEHFDIEIQSGRDGSKFADLILKKALDRETQAVHNLILTAVDGGVPLRSGTASIIVRVLDANDNAPKFDQESYTINLTENSPIGSLVVKLNATDLDEVSEPLDREKVPEYDITITVTDRGNPPLSDNETITLELLDVNDNIPQFPQTFYRIPVMENNAPGALLSSLTAIDPDLHENQYLVYFIIEKEIVNTSMSMLFSINPENVTIKLSTVETALKTYADMTEVPLGYDIFSDLNLYLVIGLGSVSFLLLITILVTIVLKCQKTKPSKAAPPCRNSVISERNSTIADSTLVSNDAYWYSLFLAETRKGKLVVRQPVPKGARYIVSSIPRSTGLTETSDSAASTLQISYRRKAHKGLGHDDKSFALCPIRFSDHFMIARNTNISNAAKWKDAQNHSSGEEMEEGSVVANLASDLGLDVKTLSKRQMRLDIRFNKKYLDVNKETGELYILEKIDREYLCSSKTATCFIKMEVTLENPVRMFNIEIEIVDINDNAPHFWRDTIRLDISESTAAGERFSLSNAVDPDIGSNSIKTYYLSESEHFDIEIQSGRDGSKFADLILKKPLDREKQASHNLILTAVDGGVPARSGTASIIVRVLDTNDNAPQFDKDSYAINLTENAPIGSLVVKLNATDKDEGSNSNILYSYSLYTSEKTQQTFSLNPDNELLDVNDNIPQFPQTFYTIPVMENNAPGALLSSLTAIDPDLHENQYLVYFIIEKEIVNTSMSMLFSINPENGNLYALKTFDYEIEKEFLFHIEARDSGVPPLSSNVTVHIIIMDQNDNTPLIVSPWRAHGSVVEEKIPRSTDKGTLIAKVIAIDSDSVHNSRITYQFLHNTDATLFSLDQYNGEIRTMRMFSYRDSRHQQLVVIAKDNGEPALSATVTIKLSTVETALKTYADMTEVPLGYDIFSDLNLYLVIGLGSVSFLLLITILVTIVLKCQKTKPSKAAPPCRNSVISERNSTIADSTLVSNDAYWYSLFLAETRKGKLVVRQPVPKGARYIVSSIPRSTGLTETSDSAASTLQLTKRRCPLRKGYWSYSQSP
ncbi:hypothetical protein QQF64_006813 [Cirrhinus molitorella]|uniref:Cadherin domain-containing protein n=1 Tax=Cirrhinus molitorella TaxID=172907 RepID=A0ABR3M8W2_9TELE